MMETVAVGQDGTTLADARELYEAGRRREAQEICRALLAETPDDPGALELLGRIFLASAQPSLAVSLLERSAALRPEPTLLLTLGRALFEAGDAAGAAAQLRRVVDADPASAKAHMHLGVALLETGDVGEAIDELSASVRLDPERAERHFYLGNALLSAGRREQADESFREAERLAPNLRHGHVMLGSRATMMGRPERALQQYRWGLELHPSDPELRHLAASLDGRDESRAPDEYVVQAFDRFADTFDEVLVERLRYRVPGLIVDAAARALGDRRDLEVLDAGCGTGLCGPLLRPLAGRLVGIDLSPEMLKRARSRGSYDELEAAEITAAMAAAGPRYDVVVAADVLVYFGDLSELFGAIAGCLLPGGVAAVSVERRDGDGFELRPSGRYAHGPGHVRATAAAAGLEEVEAIDCEGRVEALAPVPGMIFVFERRVDSP